MEFCKIDPRSPERAITDPWQMIPMALASYAKSPLKKTYFSFFHSS
jgi:hypothetical protein